MVDVETHLHRLGLSVQEARVYLALMRLGKGTVKEIRVLTGLPRSRLYDVLDHLERGGWIAKENTRPKMFFPEEPGKIGAVVKGRVDDAWKRVIGDLTALYQKTSHLQGGYIKTLRGEKNVWLRFELMLGEARNDAIIIIGFIPDYLTTRLSEILGTVKEKVTLRVVLQASLKDRVSVVGDMAFALEIPPVVVVVVDDKWVLLASAGEEEHIAISTDDTAVVEFCKITANMLWSRERKKSTKITG